MAAVPTPYDSRVITAPLAVIKVAGVDSNGVPVSTTIGKMRNIRVNEQIQRGKVIGLGSLTPSELPATGWSGSVTCDFYNIDFRKSQIPGAIFRTNNTTLEDWLNSVCLQVLGVNLEIYQRAAVNSQQPINVPGSQIKGDLFLYATIRNLFLDAEGFDLSEGQVSGRNQSFQYIEPILFIG